MSSPEASTDWPIRALGPGDLAGALQLSIEAGWNQVDADWRIFLEHGHLMGVDARGRGLVGTAATLPLGPELGWISMMLVGTPFRRRGIGRQLLGQCILDLAAQRLVPGLDATVAGRELYRHHGFRDTWAITRWRRERVPVVPPALPNAGVEIRSATAADLAAIATLDSGAFGCDRRSVLASLLARSPRLAALALRAGAPCGYLLARDGREALQLGPVAAPAGGVAIALFARALARSADAAFIDLLDRHVEVAGWLATQGFIPQRRFMRMFYGRDDPFGDARLAVAIAGPELG
jgi:ribosomal protein S18 acetylase RimI-like enzyme